MGGFSLGLESWYSKLKMVKILLLSLVCCLGFAHAQSGGIHLHTALGDTWMFEKWSSDDGAYSDIQSSVTKIVQAAIDPLSRVHEYEKAADLRPNDPSCAFACAVAAYTAMDRPTVHQFDYADLGASYLARTPSPENYEYVRLRFLFASLGDRPDPNLRQLGDRLLAKNDDDPDVLRAAGWCYFGEDNAKSVRLLLKGIKLAPNVPFGYRTLGLVYAWEWATGKNEYGAALSLPYFKKFLALSPGPSDARTDTVSWIADMTKAAQTIGPEKYLHMERE